jgi:hypothetical protein
MVSRVTDRVLATPEDEQMKGGDFSWTPRFRDSRSRVSLVLAPFLVLAVVLLVLWIREPDAFSAGAARATLASLGAPVPGGVLGSQVTADWPRSGPGIAFITAGRGYLLPGRLTVGEVVGDLQLWAARHHLGPGYVEPTICWNLSQQRYDARGPGASGPACVIGLTSQDHPFQQISVSIMFQGSGPLSPIPGEPWTDYRGNPVSQVVIDVTVTEERPLPNTD